MLTLRSCNQEGKVYFYSLQKMLRCFNLELSQNKLFLPDHLDIVHKKEQEENAALTPFYLEVWCTLSWPVKQNS